MSQMTPLWHNIPHLSIETAYQSIELYQRLTMLLKSSIIPGLLNAALKCPVADNSVICFSSVRIRQVICKSCKPLGLKNVTYV